MVTPYDPDAWDSMLARFNLTIRFPTLSTSMRRGFSVGNPAPFLTSFTPQNHPSALANPGVIDSYILDELSSGRISGPFSALFVRRNAPHWLHDAYAYCSGPMLQVAEAPEGAQGASSDVAKAYRTIPILPEHKRLIVFRHRDGFYIDHALPFGLSTAAGMHGHVADATVALLRANGMPTIKWVDDKSHRRDPTSRISDGTFNYAFDLDDIHQFLAPLQIPWQLDKCEQFSDTTRFVGFEWDYRRKCVTLPESKHQKHLAKVLDFLSHRQVSLGQVESLAGSLLHIAFIARAGRSYLPALHAFATQFANPHAIRYPPPRVTNDVRWWKATLELPDISRSILAPGPALDLDIWVDASEDFGIGIIIDGCYDAWQTRRGWKSDGRDIGWLETLALEFALRAAVERGHHDAVLVVRGDNTGARGALLKGRGRNAHTNYAIRRVELVQQLNNLEIHPIWVESAANLADGVSRGFFPSHLSRYRCNFAMPFELDGFLKHV